MVVIARPLVAARSWRNLVMLAILGALTASNVVVHLEALGVLPMGAARRACLIAIDIVAFAILLVAGRVFPMFTRNATGISAIRSSRPLEIATLAGMAVVAMLDVLSPGRASAVAAGAVGVLAVARATHWGARYTARHPLLWILHAGYGWLALGLLLRALAEFDVAVPGSLATHALTVGAIGSTTLGMMARVALGHTGRKLVAPRAAVWAFAAVTCAAVARVFVPILAPDWYFHALVGAAGLWTAAFLFYVVTYAPILVTPRADGGPG